jgi:NADH-quinone oxidoreductase subunit J
MTAQMAIFLVLAAVAIAGAVNLILQRHPIHSALSLVVVMAALAGLYLLLDAEFVAAIQIIVYAGAIMVLFIFVIMLLNAGVEERTNLSHVAQYAGIPLAALLLLELAYRVARASSTLVAQPTPEGATRQLSMLLFRNFAFPFELTSILILIGMVGALVLAKRDE